MGQRISSLSRTSLPGNFGLRVTPLCLGTVTFGTEWGWGVPDEIGLSDVPVWYAARMVTMARKRGLEDATRLESVHPYSFFEAPNKIITGGAVVEKKPSWY
jgi:hypothetical protein